jgi:hypothetical protein
VVSVTDDHLHELLRAFDNRLDDLAANRAGHLSPRQTKRLRRGGYLNLAGSVLIAAILLGILFAVAERPLKPVQLALVDVLVATVLTLGVVMAVRSHAATATGQVECIAGPVAIRLRGRAGWYLTTDYRSFKLPVQFWHIESGPSYLVYVAPKAHRIVAIEPDGW